MSKKEKSRTIKFRLNESRKIKRPRKITICLECYARRVKCDREKPSCQRCTQLGVKCEYESEGARGRGEGFENRVRIMEVNKTSESNGGYMKIDRRTGASRYTNSSHYTTFLQRSEYDVELEMDEKQTITWMSKLVEGVSRDLSDKLVNRYFMFVHPFVGMLNTVETLKDYEKFWLADGNTEFGKVLLVMWYGACISIEDENQYGPVTGIDTSHDFGRLRDEFKVRAEQALEQSGFPGSLSLSSILAATMLASCYRSSQKVQAVVNVSVLTRVAQVMGLHRDPSRFKGVTAIELRRGIWWQLVFLDALASIVNGLPPVLNCTQADVEFPRMPDGVVDQEEEMVMQISMSRSYTAHILGLVLIEVYGVQGVSRTREDEVQVMVRRAKEIGEETIKKLNQACENSDRQDLWKLASWLIELVVCKLEMLARGGWSAGTDVKPEQEQQAFRVLELFSACVDLQQHAAYLWALTVNHQLHAIAIGLRGERGDDRRRQIVDNAIAATGTLRGHEDFGITEQQWQTVLRAREQVRAGSCAKDVNESADAFAQLLDWDAFLELAGFVPADADAD
ncbi:hypothetical protein V1514DRAFT_69342 [Lipomyces japonicus]|uniref:uncharacterized protein n=1 Tax=Lipomyces japonicus TaxID=56871 RepID=UPI0034CD9939